jgi:hypothetical protein
MVEHTMDLQYDHRLNEPNKKDLNKRSYDEHGDEIERLSRRVLNECTDSQLRNTASIFLIRVYAHRGERDKVIEICETFPAFPTSRNIMMLNAYDYSDENAMPQYKKVFYELFNALIHRMSYPGRSRNKRDNHIIMEKTIELCDVFFERGEYGTFADRVIACCLNLSIDFDSDPERALRYLTKAFETAKRLDDIYNDTVKFGKNYVYESYLAQGVELEPLMDFTFHQEEITNVQNVIDIIKKRDIKDDPRIRALIDDYKPYGGVRKK